MTSKKSSFGKILLEWHSSIDRDLPWKKDNDPYRTWLSEIIMQQTRVAQGTPYYLKFIDKYPTIVHLANAPEDEIMKMWQGLGYYSRARNLHATAKIVRDNYNGQFPKTYKEILSLKGVGEYTAAAIMSFSYNAEYPVIDGNVYRVISRVFGITEAIDITSTKKKIATLAKDLIKGNDPASYNQAIMDFGALQCTPKKPSCSDCPFVEICIAKKDDLVSEIPYKSKKIIKKNRYLHYLIIEDNEDNTYINHRKEKDIWQSLFDYPSIENENIDLLKKEDITQYFSHHINHDLSISHIDYPQKAIKHILTHQNIYGLFYKIRVNKILPEHSIFTKIKKENLDQYASPVLIINYRKKKQPLQKSLF